MAEQLAGGQELLGVGPPARVHSKTVQHKFQGVVRPKVDGYTYSAVPGSRVLTAAKQLERSGAKNFQCKVDFIFIPCWEGSLEADGLAVGHVGSAVDWILSN